MSGFLQCMVADVGRKLAQNPELGVILSYVENTLDTDPNYLQKMRDEYINEGALLEVKQWTFIAFKT